MRPTILVLLALTGWSASAGATASKPVLTLADARGVIAAAIDYARQHQAPGAAIVVVDDGGSVVALERLDGTFPSGPNVSIGKARTAAGFQRATRDIENTINKGRFTMTALPAVTNFTPLQGGVPLSVGGHIVGAVGVSGAASAQQDDEIAQAAADAFAAKSTKASTNESPVRHIPAADVQRAFATGARLLAAPSYKVEASRRETAGQAEVHLHDTDIIYVLDGMADLVTGGEVIDPVDRGSGEIRGSSIRGGTTWSLQKGDVLSVANGTPHWFKSVRAPFTYYVVKSANQGD